jgi:putative chitinase
MTGRARTSRISNFPPPSGGFFFGKEPSMAFINTLHNLWPNGDQKIPGLRDGMAASAQAVFRKYGIDSPLLVAHVMAQISHECGAGHDVVENLNYTAGRMMQVWPSRFPTMASAQPYAGNPRALANKVYNGRMGNATGSDDGWNFRGRGASQTTGREGYARLAKATGLDLLNHPDLVNDPQRFLECGVADFVLCGCLPFAKADDVLNVTRRLNGGTVGLAQRQAWLAKWKAALGSGPIVFGPAPVAARKPAPVSPTPVAAPQSMLGRFIAALIAAFRRK